jgi:hypothetical protein
MRACIYHIGRGWTAEFINPPLCCALNASSSFETQYRPRKQKCDIFSSLTRGQILNFNGSTHFIFQKLFRHVHQNFSLSQDVFEVNRKPMRSYICCLSFSKAGVSLIKRKQTPTGPRLMDIPFLFRLKIRLIRQLWRWFWQQLCWWLTECISSNTKFT